MIGDLRKLETIFRQADFDERSEKQHLKVRVDDGAPIESLPWQRVSLDFEISLRRSNLASAGLSVGTLLTSYNRFGLCLVNV